MTTKIITSYIDYESGDPESALSIRDLTEMTAAEKLNLVHQLLPIQPDKLTRDMLALRGLYYLDDVKEQKGIEITNLDTVYVLESYGSMKPVDERVIPLLAKKDPGLSFWLPVSIEHSAVGKALAKARKEWEGKNADRIAAKKAKEIEKARKTLAALEGTA